MLGLLDAHSLHMPSVTCKPFYMSKRAYNCNNTVGRSELSPYGHVGTLPTYKLSNTQTQSHRVIFAGRVVGSVMGSLVLAAVIVTMISIYLFFMWRRKQRVKMLQMDIFARCVSCLCSQNCALHMSVHYFPQTWEYSQRWRVRDVQQGNTIS